MNPRLPALLLAILVLLPSACGGNRELAPDQLELVAWYVEDMAHGNLRRPDELVLPGSSEAMERVATWLAGGQVRDEHLPPRQVASRRERWPALKALFLQGSVVVLDDGLVAAMPTLPQEDRAYILPVIDAENLDRRAIDALVISLIRAGRGEAGDWLAQSARARLASDTQAGGKRWIGRYDTGTGNRRIEP